MSHVFLIFGENKIRWTKGIQHFKDLATYFTRFGMALELLLGKDQLAIDRNLKYTAGSGDQFPAFHEIFDCAFFQNFFRQTDGTWCVISSGTIVDSDVHQSILHRFAPLFLTL